MLNINKLQQEHTQGFDGRWSLADWPTMIRGPGQDILQWLEEDGICRVLEAMGQPSEIDRHLVWRAFEAAGINNGVSSLEVWWLNTAPWPEVYRRARQKLTSVKDLDRAIWLWPDRLVILARKAEIHMREQLGT